MRFAHFMRYTIEACGRSSVQRGREAFRFLAIIMRDHCQAQSYYLTRSWSFESTTDMSIFELAHAHTRTQRRSSTRPGIRNRRCLNLIKSFMRSLWPRADEARNLHPLTTRELDSKAD